MGGKGTRAEYVKRITISLMAGYLVTLVGIIILAMMLLLFQLTEDTVNIGIIVIYVLSSFGTGFFAGKGFKIRKFAWGMFTGILYYLILMIISVSADRSLVSQSRELITVFLLCLGGGTLGGMLS